MKLHNVNIPSGADELSAVLYEPSDQNETLAVLLTHGFTAGKYTLDSLAGYLAEKGYRCLTFDVVGHKLGGTGGQLRHMQQALDNLNDALGWLRLHERPANVALVGHSMGGILSMRCATIERHEGPRHPGGQIAGAAAIAAGMMPSAGFSTKIGKTMLDQRSDYIFGAAAADLLAELDGIAEETGYLGGIPALCVAARQDVVVSVGRAEELADRVGGELLMVESSHIDAPDKCRGVILTWLEKLTAELRRPRR